VLYYIYIMDSLPAEIVTHVSSCLPKRDLKSFRLCCKAFGEIGQANLFADFDFNLYPSSHRLYQLEQLAKHKDIASQLRCLCFESGVPLEYADYRYWQANEYNDISSEWARQLAAKGVANSEYQQFHNDLQARFTAEMPRRYELYRWHLDQESGLMAAAGAMNTLAKATAALKQINPRLKFKIIMKEPRIALHDLEQFDTSLYQFENLVDPDPRRRVLLRRKHCLQHFINFLTAPSTHHFVIEQLSAVDVPHELLTDTDASAALSDICPSLQLLDLKLGALPHSDWLSRGGIHEIYTHGRDPAARSLRMLLNKTTNLEHLRLEFPEYKVPEFSFEILDRTNLDRFPRLFVPHLRSFALCRFRSSWGNLKCFLEEARSLRSLSLAYCRLETGSMLDLIHFIPRMKLQSVALIGRWYVDEDSGEWHAHSADDFTMDCFATTSYEGPYLHDGMKARVESFMLVGGECPLPTWTPQGREEDIWEMKGDTSWHFLPGLPRGH
jgi:hypothetical protein